LQSINVFTDGSFHDKQGGWASLIIYPDNTQHRLAGYCPRGIGSHFMERQALIEALERLTQPYSLTIWTDSQFLITGATQGVSRRYFNQSILMKPVKDRRIWARLERLLQPHKVEFKYTNSCAYHLEAHSLSRWARMNKGDLDRVTLGVG